MTSVFSFVCVCRLHPFPDSGGRYPVGIQGTSGDTQGLIEVPPSLRRRRHGMVGVGWCGEKGLNGVEKRR